MNILILILVGGIIGWLASIIMRTNTQQGILANIIVGVIGSLLGAWIFGSLFGIGSAFAAGTLSFIGIFWGVVGAIIFIAILKALNVFR